MSFADFRALCRRRRPETVERRLVRPLPSIGVPALVIHDNGDPMFPIEHGRALVGLRLRHPWLVRARTVVEHLANTLLLLRVTDGTSELLVALNLGEPDTVVLPSQPWHLVAGSGQVAGNCVILAAHGWCVLAPARR